MIFGMSRCALLLLALGCCGAERWRFPDDAEAVESVRIDAKVGFVDDEGTRRNNRQNIQSDDVTFQQPTGSEGFYNRLPGSGRYPVRVEPGRDDDRVIRINGRPAYNDESDRNEKYQDGTVDSLQYCKCVSTPDCQVQTDYANACGANQYLCCYKRPANQNGFQSELFNEVDEERPMLFPGQPNAAGPFSLQNFDNNGIYGSGQGAFQNQPGVLVGPGGPTGTIGPQKRPMLVGPDGPTGVVGPAGFNRLEGNKRPVLVGPDGPTGVIGPAGFNTADGNKRPVLVGPGGPTGIIGPAGFNGAERPERPVLVGPEGPTGVTGPNNNNRPVLVGPGGPTGIIGPQKRPVLVGPGGPTGVIGPGGPNSVDPERPVLVGPGGPTGIIGPADDDRENNLLVRPLGSQNDIRQSGSAQRGILVGPGGPTGIIGPDFFGAAFNRPVLVGPGGPTGFIGPRLVGPGGPTGRIGPDFGRQAGGRGVLVGPGGPTGRIGPRNFFGI